MSLNIFSVDISDLQMTKSVSRADENVKQLMEVISNMQPNTAKAIIPEEGESTRKLRLALIKAAKIQSVQLQINVLKDGRILFALGKQEISNMRKTNMPERKKKIQEKAIELGKLNKTVTIQAILDSLEEDSTTFYGIKRPGTTVSSVIRSMPNFERTSKGEYIFKDV